MEAVYSVMALATDVNTQRQFGPGVVLAKALPTVQFFRYQVVKAQSLRAKAAGADTLIFPASFGAWLKVYDGHVYWCGLMAMFC